MKFNIKSKAGFTLIELLVVIGILAVLAAIAIPSVAGLIDRANVSADKTNSNEMTNAVERFASEYELYCQDIASGALDEDNLDSAQGRVKNVVGVTTRAGIEGIEKPQTAKAEDTTGIAIYRDTKYPVNAETMKKIVENYTKTSSSTFEPKQSDMHYWYSPDCGVVVVAEPETEAKDLDKLIVSGKDAKGKDISSDSVNAQWIDLTLGAALSGGSSETETLVAGATFNDGTFLTWEDLKSTDNGSEYGYDAASINDTYIGASAFNNCNRLISITIPDGVTSIGDSAFTFCDELISLTISDSVTSIGSEAFSYCNNLTNITFGDSITSIGNKAFAYCKSITSITLPDSITSISKRAFGNCTSLTSITIPDGVTSIDEYAFNSCNKLPSITIPDSVTSISSYALRHCDSLQDITFEGTKAQWDAISIGLHWNIYIPATVVHCTDGDVAI